jgi:hypothetical protein
MFTSISEVLDVNLEMERDLFNYFILKVANRASMKIGGPTYFGCYGGEK